MDESGQSTHAHLAVIVGGYATFQFVATRYLQDSRGWSPIQMALGFCPRGSWSSRARSSRTGYWNGSAPEFSSRWGLLAFLIGYLWFLRVEPGASHVVFLLPTIVFVGLGFAICVPSVNSQHTAGVFDNEQGLASGLVNTSIQIGGALMMALITAISGSAEPGQAGELIGRTRPGRADVTPDPERVEASE